MVPFLENIHWSVLCRKKIFGTEYPKIPQNYLRVVTYSIFFILMCFFLK